MKFFKVAIDTFNVTDEMMIVGILSAYITNASKGVLLVLHSESTCAVHSLSKNSEIAIKSLSLIRSYFSDRKWCTKRSKEIKDSTANLRLLLCTAKSQVVAVGGYPLVKKVSLDISNDIENISIKAARPIETMKSDIMSYLEGSRSFHSKEARELVVVNISDVSGSISKLPHTLLAASYLTGSSLKLIVSECFSSLIDFVECLGVVVVNLGVDGESLHLASKWKDGTPGTDLSLAKEIISKLKAFSKAELVQLVAENTNIDISLVDLGTEEKEFADDIPAVEDIDRLAEESVSMLAKDFEGLGSLEDLEFLLKRGTQANSDSLIDSRLKMCKKLKIDDLRFLCLKETFQRMKFVWLSEHYGSGYLQVNIEGEISKYTPHTVFEKNIDGYYRTMTFDAAHIANLLRESAAKGKLAKFGLSAQSLKDLSSDSNFSYLKKILSLKNGGLEFDPMNQACSYKLFSVCTEEGLKNIGDKDGALCCKVFREGVIEAMDTSGIESNKRCRFMINLKDFIDRKTDITTKVKRPGPDEISNELLQMLYCTLDSHIVSYVNLEFYNPRRKSTCTVEQFFSQITLMNDGGRKLYCDVVSDILERVTITSALRLIPNDVKVIVVSLNCYDLSRLPKPVVASQLSFNPSPF